MFERTKAKIRLHRICKALGVEPYPEMVRYVIDRDETIFRGGRRNGKTLALIIDELVYKRIPPALLGCPMECRFCKDPDYWKMPQMRRDRFYISELARAVQRCETAGIDVGRGKCDNIREVHDPRKGRDGDYCIPCIERMDSRRPSPIHADEKERVLRCECFTPIPEDEEGEK